MQTPLGEVPDDDAAALEYRLWWYLRYGNQPTGILRETAAAKIDYGAQYERFVGHLFEEKGFQVRYNGLREGMNDGGIDLIARAPRKIRLIQCKRWNRAVDCDTISRLHGGVERYVWNERKDKPAQSRTHILGVLVTSGDVEPDAQALAEHLGVFVMKNLAYQAYPAVKAQEIVDGMGRFLLPFNPGYDKMPFCIHKGGRFFNTVREALVNGFYYPPYHQKILTELYRRRKQQTLNEKKNDC